MIVPDVRVWYFLVIGWWRERGRGEGVRRREKEVGRDGKLRENKDFWQTEKIQDWIAC